MKKYILSLICVSVIVGSVGAAVGLSVMSPKKETPPAVVEREIDSHSAADDPALPTVMENTPEPARIKPSTRIMYEYVYQADNRTETSEKDPPYFLLDQPREKIADYYLDWDIIEFNENQVKLRRTVPELFEDQFVLGVKDDYVAVYHRSNTGAVRLKEVTGTPIGALSPDEQSKLMAGINIGSEEQLAKMLEDYGS